MLACPHVLLLAAPYKLTIIAIEELDGVARKATREQLTGCCRGRKSQKSPMLGKFRYLSLAAPG